MEQLGAGSWPKRVLVLAQPALELVGPTALECAGRPAARPQSGRKKPRNDARSGA
jgi:hypothetical protein